MPWSVANFLVRTAVRAQRGLPDNKLLVVGREVSDTAACKLLYSLARFPPISCGEQSSMAGCASRREASEPMPTSVSKGGAVSRSSTTAATRNGRGTSMGRNHVIMETATNFIPRELAYRGSHRAWLKIPGLARGRQSTTTSRRVIISPTRRVTPRIPRMLGSPLVTARARRKP